MTSNERNLWVGAFVVFGAFLLTSSLMILSGGQFFRHQERFVLVFDGSVQGLKAGAPVAIKGVQIGEVLNIKAQLNSKNLNIVTIVPIEVDPKKIKLDKELNADKVMSELVKKGMRAQLQSSSLLTGLLYVNIDFFPKTPIKHYDIPTEYPQFPTVQTDLEKITETLNQIDFDKLTKQLTDTISGIDHLVNDPNIPKILANAERMTANFATLSANANQQINITVKELRTLMGNLNNVAVNVDKEIPTLSKELNQSLTGLQASNQKLGVLLERASFLMSDDSPTLRNIQATSTQLERTARSLEQLSDTLEKKPDSIIWGK